MFLKTHQRIRAFNTRHQQQINILLGCVVILVALAGIIHGVVDLISLKVSSFKDFNFDIRFVIREAISFILFFSGVLLFDGSKFSYRVNMFLLILFISVGPWLHLYHAGYFTLSISIVLLLLYRHSFNNSLYLPYGIILVLGFILSALFYGAIGSYILRSQFVGIKDIHDAIYFTIVTFSTVGYGDIVPTTPTAKYFVISMIIIGLVMFTSGVTLVAYNVNNKLKDVLFNINKGRISMRSHVVIIGYGTLARILMEQYRRDGKQFILIDTIRNLDVERKILMDNQQLFISPHMGDSETLVRARVEDAALVIICYDTDEESIFSTMGVREYLDKINAKVKLVTRVFYEGNIEKAKKAGADEVIAPHVLAAQAIFGLKTE